jgi:ParB-like chromosome segregation protein Spo0J
VLTTEETAAAIFGSIADVDAGRQVARPINIFEIYPDPLQPRRAVPSSVRSHWDGRPSTTAALFSHWHLLAKDERGQDFSLEPYVLAAEDVQRPEKIGPVDLALMDVAELAANIRSGGLINPVTVVRAQQSYRLETGERRWLAYHLLYLMFENEQDTWGRIPARVVEEFSVWRQAGENNARENLNAISKARQLALLIMNLYERQGVRFASYDEMVQPGESDRMFYSQVGEGQGSNARPIPYGSGELILNAMGFKQPSQIRECRDLLRLPDEVWQIADDLHWTQGKIRELKRRSEGDDQKLISLAVKQAEAERYSVGIVVEDSTPLPRKAKKQPDGVFLSAENKKRLHKMWRLAERVGEARRKLSETEKYEIKMVIEWLTELQRLAGRQQKEE